MDLLSGAAFVALFRSYRTAFRAEFRENYRVESDRTADGTSDYERWAAGAEAPDAERKGALLQDLREELSDGRRLYRVKVMHRSPYDLYSAEWGYAYNVQAGEEVRILDLHEQDLPQAAEGLPDFWLIDDRALLMHYDDEDRFLGAGYAADADRPRYLAARDALLATAVDFQVWWSAHPELHHRRPGANLTR